MDRRLRQHARIGTDKALRALFHLAGASLMLGLTACEAVRNVSPLSSDDGAPTTLAMQQPADVKYFPSDEPLRLGVEHLNRGNFGLAERYFRDAVEKAPKDAMAWIGLAASYDRLARFDLADGAYRQAIALSGETTQVLNNQGYSYMLRGDLRTARAKFLKAYEREPTDPTIINNLELLNSSYRFIQRDGPG